MSVRLFWQRRFFWQMVLSLLLVALVLFSVLHDVAQHVTIKMTVLKAKDQQILRDYAELASEAQQSGDALAIVELTRQIADELSVWSAVQTAEGQLVSSNPIPISLADKLGFQRLVEWPVHSFMNQVLIGIPMQQEGYSFVIELPDYMHPRPNTSMVYHSLTLVAPSLVLMLFCWLFYRYLMRPLEALNRGTLKFAEGDLSARVQPELSGRRRDEITQLASSFDSMADRIQRLVNSHRQLLGDLSHELRTPLTRLELALEQCKQAQCKTPELLPRLSREVDLMKHLVDDALTLAWLDSEPEVECADEYNLSTLLDLLCDDAEFEYPDHTLAREYPAQCPLTGSNQRALAHSIENVLRNALKYSPRGSTVTVRAGRSEDGSYLVEVIDQGPGVDSSQLDKIFEPFFRTDKARSREEGGFGLGLALVRRQLEATGGKVDAYLNKPSGLCVRMQVPCGSTE